MSLEGRKIAVLAAGGYQELELWYPVLRAREDGASVYVLSSDPAGVTSNLGYPLIPDAAGADAADVDAVVLAGTVTGVPAYSDEQRAFVRAAHQGTARIYSVGTATTAVASILASIRGLAGWSFGVVTKKVPSVQGGSGLSRS